MANKYKKFVASAATATLVASAIVPVASANETVTFSDVKDSSEFAPFIYDLAEKKVMSGAAGKFNPAGEVTRNAAVKTLGKWLVNVHGKEIPADFDTVQRFNDLPVDYKDQELVQYAALVKDLGVFTGSAGNLNPTGTLTREQMAKVVVEAYSVVEGIKIVDLVKDFESSLTDLDKVSASNVDYVKVFEKYGITTVKTFNPKGKIQRQHFAKFLSLAINDEKLAADTEVLVAEKDKEEATTKDTATVDLTAVETAVAALPKVEEVTKENAEAATKAVEAVTAAVAAAKTAIAAAELTEEAKTAAEATVAAAEAAAKAVADKVAEVTELVALDSVTAINETTVSVKLAEDTKLEEADLKGKTITLTNGETTLTATYAEASLSGSVAVFELAEGTKLVDAAEYKVASKWASFKTASFVAEIGTAYAKTFKAVTTKVFAGETGTVYVKGFDQYGEEIAVPSNVSFEGSTLNGMPIDTDLRISGNVITLNKAVKAGDKLVVKVSNVVEKETVGSATFEYTVEKVEAGVNPTAPNSIEKIEALDADGKVVSKFAANDTVTLKATVLDLASNPVTTTSEDAIRWVVKEGKELLADKGSNSLGKDVATADLKVGENPTFVIKSKGTIVVEAYNTANGNKATYTLTAGAQELKTLTFDSKTLTGFNQEEVILGKVEANTGAAVAAADLKFRVVNSKGEATSKASVKAVVATKDDKSTYAEGTVYLVATTTEKGSYSVVPFVGTSVEDTKAVKVQAPITFTTDFNDTAVAIADVKVSTLKVGAPVTTELVVTNKHGENIASKLLDKTTPDVAVTVYQDGKVVEGKVAVEFNYNSEKEIGEVKLTATAKGSYTVRLSVKDTAATKDINVIAEETTVKSVNLGADIYDIISNDKDVYRVVTVKDSKDDVIVGKIGSEVGELALDGSVSGVTLVYVKKDAKGNWTTVNTASDAEAVAVKFAEAIAKTVSPLTVKVKVNQAVDATTTPITDELKVTVKEARKLENITVNKTAVTTGLNGTTSFVVNAVDQYKTAYVPTADDLEKLVVKSTATDSKLTISSPDAVVVKGEVTGYKYTVTGNAVANETLQVLFDDEVKASVNASVVEAADVVSAIAFEGDNFNADGSYKYQVQAGQEVELFDVIGKSTAGEVAVDPSKVVWTSSSKLVTIANGKLVVESDEAKIEKDTVVTVTADLYGKKVSVDLTVSKEEGKLVASTLAVKDAEDIDANASKAGLQIALDGDDKDGEENGAIELTFTGKDQYGNDLTALDAVLAFKESVATATTSADTVIITSVAKGETQVRVTVDGVDFLVDVTVNDKAVAARNAQ